MYQAVPGDRIDPLIFTVTAPVMVRSGGVCVVDVWAHLAHQGKEVLDRARQMSNGPIASKSKGSVQVARGTSLVVRLAIEDMVIDEPQDSIWWDGEIGNATFPVKVPAGVSAGGKLGHVAFYAGGLQVARLHFSLQVGDSTFPTDALPVRQERHQKAFASYAAEDRGDVLPRIQGMQKAAPALDVFLDVHSLRSGQDWERELFRVIPSCDVFYLFWSANARRSEWVEKEWRYALQSRGLAFIDPVPLAAPDEVAPPDELAGKHFNDWTLAFARSSAGWPKKVAPVEPPAPPPAPVGVAVELVAIRVAVPDKLEKLLRMVKKLIDEKAPPRLVKAYNATAKMLNAAMEASDLDDMKATLQEIYFDSV